MGFWEEESRKHVFDGHDLGCGLDSWSGSTKLPNAFTGLVDVTKLLWPRYVQRCELIESDSQMDHGVCGQPYQLHHARRVTVCEEAFIQMRGIVLWVAVLLQNWLDVLLVYTC